MGRKWTVFLSHSLACMDKGLSSNISLSATLEIYHHWMQIVMAWRSIIKTLPVSWRTWNSGSKFQESVTISSAWAFGTLNKPLLSNVINPLHPRHPRKKRSDNNLLSTFPRHRDIAFIWSYSSAAFILTRTFPSYCLGSVSDIQTICRLWDLFPRTLHAFLPCTYGLALTISPSGWQQWPPPRLSSEYRSNVSSPIIDKTVFDSFRLILIQLFQAWLRYEVILNISL